jgi:hypothetical protein
MHIRELKFQRGQKINEEISDFFFPGDSPQESLGFTSVGKKEQKNH